MKSFFDTKHCTSKLHCEVCRASKSFRESISKVYDVPCIDFACPYEAKEKPEQKLRILPPMKKCNCSKKRNLH